MELLFNILWVILAVLALIIIYVSAGRFARIMNSKNLMERDMEIYKIKYDESTILSHLDFIIQECFDYYIAMHVTPKQVYYINNAMEEEITNALAEMVQLRISSTLYTQLSLIYDNSQIGMVIGEKIYTKVLEYVIEFNINYEHMQKNKKPE